MTDLIAQYAPGFIKWILEVVVLKYLVVHGAGHIITWLFKKAWHILLKNLLKTEADLKYYLANRNRAMQRKRYLYK